MKKRALIYVLVFSMVMALLAGCGKKPEVPAPTQQPTPTKAEAGKTEAGKKVKFAIILGVGGLGDNGYNDEVFQGVKMAAQQFGATYDYAEPKDITQFETQLRMFADAKVYDTIIAISTEQAEALKMVAKDYPEQKFTMLDTKIDGFKNVHSITASHPEQHFLSGMLAGIATQDKRFPLSNDKNILGFTIAMDTPTSRAQAAGFLAGAKYVNPKVEILTNYIGAYNNPVTAKELALVMYERGADIVSANAGASTQGVFAAAKQVNRYVIGTSLAMKDPKISLSTSVKKVWFFVTQEIESLTKGTWQAGNTVKGIKDGVCDYDVEGLDVKIPEDVVKILNDTKKLISEGKLVLPNDIKEVDEWAAKNQLKK